MNTCLSCGKPIANTYCSNKCQMYKRYTDYVERWLEGLECGWVGKTRQLSGHIRRYLHETRGTACRLCKWDVRHPIDNSVLTEVNHIDGNAENNIPSNLEILCPNCHSMTFNFRSRNRNSTRIRR